MKQKKGKGDDLAAPWLASGPRSGARAWTGAGSRRRPGPGPRGGTCLSHFFLGVMGRWGRVFCRRGRLGARSRSSSGLSARPLPVSGQRRKRCEACPSFLHVKSKVEGEKEATKYLLSSWLLLLLVYIRPRDLRDFFFFKSPHHNVSERSKSMCKHPERMNTHSRGLPDLLRWRS